MDITDINVFKSVSCTSFPPWDLLQSLQSRCMSPRLSRVKWLSHLSKLILGTCGLMWQTPPIGAAVANGCVSRWDQSVSSLRESPQYLSKNGHQSPFEIRNKTLQDAIHTDTQASNLGMKSLPITKSFNTPSSGNQSAKTSWVDWLPIQEQLLDGVTGRQEEVLVVNMTGDGGYDLQAFKRKFPNVRGRLILQDQLDVISKIQNLDSSIECMEHDFLSPQPIIGN